MRPENRNNPMNSRHGPQPPGLPFKSQKIAREYEIIKAMMGIYCRKVHGRQPSICDNCRELLDYSEKKLRLCRFFEKKPRCRDCPAPCFAQPQKNHIREIMKFAGPRLPFHHPWLAFHYFWSKNFDFQNIFSCTPKAHENSLCVKQKDHPVAPQKHDM